MWAALWREVRRRADKPGSVVDDHLSRLHVAVQFLARYPNAGRAGPWRSYSRLLRKGLAKPPCCHDAGGLLHHRLHVAVQFLARYPNAGRAGPWRSYSRLLRKGLAKPPCCHDAGGLLHHRVSFSRTRTSAGSGSRLCCGANPSGRPAWPLTSFLPYGARTFLTPATRAGRAIVWPASRGGIVPCGRRSCERTGLHPCSNSLKQSWARAKAPQGPSARAETARERSRAHSPGQAGSGQYWGKG